MKFAVSFALAMFALSAGVCLSQDDSFCRPENLKSRTVEYYQEDELVNKATHEFDRDGNMTRFVQGIGEAAREWKYANEYEAAGRLSEITQTQKEVKQAVTHIRYKNPGGKLKSSMELYEFAGQKGEEDLVSTTISKYRADGKIISEKRADFVNAAIVIGSRDYVYREDGTLEKVIQKYDGVAVSYTYKQDAKGRTSEIRLENTASGTLLDRKTYQWDDYGNVTEFCQYGLDDKLERQDTYKYKHHRDHYPVSALASSVMLGGVFTAEAKLEFKYEFYEKE
jgi:hypothetical protein